MGGGRANRHSRMACWSPSWFSVSERLRAAQNRLYYLHTFYNLSKLALQNSLKKIQLLTFNIHTTWRRSRLVWSPWRQFARVGDTRLAWRRLCGAWRPARHPRWPICPQLPPLSDHIQTCKHFWEIPR